MKQVTRPQTVLVELLGLPRTGKSSTARALVKFLREKGLTPQLVFERASVCPITDKLDPLFNLWTASALCREYFAARGRGVDVVIADRGIIDGLIWSSSFRGDHSSSPDADSLEMFLKMPAIEQALVAAYFFTSTLDVVIARHKVLQIVPVTGTVVNQKVLTRYLDAYDSIVKSQIVACPLVEVDTADLGLGDVVRQVGLDLWQRLKGHREDAG